MTTLMTSTHCTSTTAWRFTTLTSTSTECTYARIVSPSLIIHTHFGSSSSFVRTPLTTKLWPSMWSLRLDFFLLLLRLLSVFFFPLFHLSDEQQPELNKKTLENVCDPATNGGDGTYDVFCLSTGYEPSGHDFIELQNSSVHLCFKIPAADQDVDDLTLGKMLTEAYRGQVDYLVQGGVSVSQFSSFLRSDRSGQFNGDGSE